LQNINLDQPIAVSGQTLKAGDVEVRWVTHSPQATVTFVQRKSLVTADGVFVARPEKPRATQSSITSIPTDQNRCSNYSSAVPTRC